MGMDVFGKHPTNDTGTYFRASVWGWAPLAEYLCDVAPHLMANVTYFVVEAITRTPRIR